MLIVMHVSKMKGRTRKWHAGQNVAYLAAERVLETSICIPSAAARTRG